ncbi:MAG: PD40 domain-containing protein [Candidatus Eisenbacteria bacterium]|nr:PD40 domain-containing protein [Candidatus Eisenbacteria bacterium]MCC7144556.1 PD40 domain-containing protein [Candidatus Eisenbacteria bacterium]
MDRFPDWNAANGGQIVYERTAVSWSDVLVRGSVQIWMINMSSGKITYLTRGQLPVWSPDGRSIAFGRQLQDGIIQIHRLDIESGEIAQITDGPGQKPYSDWSPDGASIVFTADASALGLWHLDLTTGTRRFLTRQITSSVCWSADGRWIAGGNGVRMTPIAAPDSVQVLVWMDAITPRFSPDGKALGFVDYANHERRATSIIELDTLKKRRLVEYGLEMAWSPDGESFVYSALDSVSNVTVLYVARLDGTDCYQLTRLEDYALPDSTGK